MKMVDGKMIPDDNVNTTFNIPAVKIETEQQNTADVIKETIKPVEHKHAENLIKLLQNNFANSKERVQAENKIRNYFKSKE